MFSSQMYVIYFYLQLFKSNFTEIRMIHQLAIFCLLRYFSLTDCVKNHISDILVYRPEQVVHPHLRLHEY